MSAELEIPDAAWGSAMDAAESRVQRSDIVAKALVAAAPLIVAAELDRLAANWAHLPEVPYWILRDLRDRAAQLRGAK